MAAGRMIQHGGQAGLIAMICACKTAKNDQRLTKKICHVQLFKSNSIYLKLNSFISVNHWPFLH
jgi:hypothetical protein